LSCEVMEFSAQGLVQCGATGPWRLGAVDGLCLAPFRSRGGLTVETVATWSARTYGLSTPAFTLLPDFVRDVT